MCPHNRWVAATPNPDVRAMLVAWVGFVGFSAGVSLCSMATTVPRAAARAVSVAFVASVAAAAATVCMPHVFCLRGSRPICHSGLVLPLRWERPKRLSFVSCLVSLVNPKKLSLLRRLFVLLAVLDVVSKWQHMVLVRRRLSPCTLFNTRPCTSPASR